MTTDPAAGSASIDAAFEAFEHRRGRSPDGIWCAPGRVNLMGEHTDYNGGRCLPIALEHVTAAAVSLRDDGVVTAESLQTDVGFTGRVDDLAPERISGWSAYAVGVVWALREAGLEVPGVDVVVSGSVPIGAGLSSSASLECSVALGVAELCGWSPPAAVGSAGGADDVRRRLIDAGIRAERDVAGAPTGGLDQTVSLLALEGHALAIDFADGSLRHVEWAPEQAGLELVVIDTRVTHDLASGGYAERRAECERAAAMLGVARLAQAAAEDLERLEDPRLRSRARHVLTEDERVDGMIDDLVAEHWDAVGDSFDASHASLRDDFEVSCDELDVARATAVDNGAIGARMTGGGFGGSVVALVPAALVSEMNVAVDTEFRRRGWRRPAFLSGRAGAGARRVR